MASGRERGERYPRAEKDLKDLQIPSRQSTASQKHANGSEAIESVREFFQLVKTEAANPTDSGQRNKHQDKIRPPLRDQQQNPSRTITTLSVKRRRVRYKLQMFPPPPIVVDADVLYRNVDYAVRKGYSGALFGVPNPRYSLLSGVAPFASTSVHGEAVRHLPEIAKRREVPEEEVWRVWNQLVLKAVRFVPLAPGTIEDPRIAGVDPSDRPTAELASLLSPSILLTDNRKHFRSFDLGETRSDDIAVDLFQIGQFTVGAKGVAFVPTAGGAAMIDLAKKMAAKLGVELTVALGLLGLAGAGYLLTRPRGQEFRGRVADAGRRVLPVIAEQATATLEASQRVGAFAIDPAGSPDALSILARHLAVHRSAMSTADVSRLLKDYGLVFSGGRDHRTETRAWLEAELCFSEIRRGHWAVGFHARDLASTPASSSVSTIS